MRYKQIQTAVMAGILAVATAACGQAAPKTAEIPQIGIVEAHPSPEPPQSTTPEPMAAEVVNEAVPSGEPVVLRLRNPDMPYTPADMTASVPAYAVETGLANVANKDAFGPFTDNQTALLAQNGFVVTPTANEQMFFIYDENMYKGVPSFITTDTMLQTYHVFYSYLLRQTETNSLLPKLETLTANMLSALVSEYGEAEDADLKARLLVPIAYYAVAAELLNLPDAPAIPEEAKRLKSAELSLVNSADHYTESPLTGAKVLYQNFTVRGHYTRTVELTRYFKAMMWYGTIAFPMFGQNAQPDTGNVFNSMVITKALVGLPFEDGAGVWQDIYSPTVFFTGESDDLTPFEFWDVMQGVYGGFPAENFASIVSPNDTESLAKTAAAAAAKKEAKIQKKMLDETAVCEFRFMGQRYLPDADIMQALCEPLMRPFATGLDVMGVLGSERAEKHIEAYENPAEKWPDYPAEYAETKAGFDSLKDETWRKDIYYGWLWSLKPLLEKVPEGFPSFMQSGAWLDKSLSSALGSWAELRHDTVLYGKQPMAQMGGGDEPGEFVGYVEPNVEAYSRLLWLADYTRENLSMRGMLTESMEGHMNNYAEMLQTLVSISEKELRNEPVSQEESWFIMGFGGRMERLLAAVATDDTAPNWYLIESPTDRNMALVTDVANTPEYFLHEGVGTASEIFVVVPNPDGRLYIARGAVFDYFEFASDTKMSDEDWQQRIKNGTQPERPAWTRSFIDTTGIGREIPPLAITAG